MPNIATVLKEEISRLARKELREENQALKKASVQYRADIASLKRRMAVLEKLVAGLGKGAVKKPAAVSTDQPANPIRFSAKGLTAQRLKLGLSRIEAATLLGVSDQSVYKWEDGRSLPRAKQLPAIALFRALSKAQAAEKLQGKTR